MPTCDRRPAGCDWAASAKRECTTARYVGGSRCEDGPASLSSSSDCGDQCCNGGNGVNCYERPHSTSLIPYTNPTVFRQIPTATGMIRTTVGERMRSPRLALLLVYCEILLFPWRSATTPCNSFSQAHAEALREAGGPDARACGEDQKINRRRQRAPRAAGDLFKTCHNRSYCSCRRNERQRRRR